MLTLLWLALFTNTSQRSQHAALFSCTHNKTKPDDDFSAEAESERRRRQRERGGGGAGAAEEGDTTTCNEDGDSQQRQQPPCTGIFASHTDWVTGLAVAAGRIMVSSSNDGTLKLWDLAAANKTNGFIDGGYSRRTATGRRRESMRDGGRGGRSVNSGVGNGVGGGDGGGFAGDGFRGAGGSFFVYL